MDNYFIANGALAISIYLLIEVILWVKYIYPTPGKKKMELKTAIIISVSILIVFAIIVIIVSITDYQRWGNTRFLDIKEHIVYKTLPTAIKSGIICVSVVIGRYIYIWLTGGKKNE